MLAINISHIYVAPGMMRVPTKAFILPIVTTTSGPKAVKQLMVIPIGAPDGARLTRSLQRFEALPRCLHYQDGLRGGRGKWGQRADG